jgi:hypothetical protein
MGCDEFASEAYLIELGHHLAFLKLTQATAIFARRASRMLFGENIKLGAIAKLFDYVFG